MWPFNKAKKQLATKSASYLFGPARLQQMQNQYETFASEGYGMNPVAQACINRIASAIISVDIKAYIPGKDGKMDEKPDHPMLKLLNNPNPAQSGEDFFRNFIGYYLIAGNAYVLDARLDNRPSNRPPKELYLLKPNCVKVNKGTGVLPESYEYRIADGKSEIYPVDQISGRSLIMHKKTFNPVCQHEGLSPMVAAALGIDIVNAGDKWNLRLLQNEARPSGALVVQGEDGGAKSLSDEEYRRLSEMLDQQISGANNAGRPLLLEGGLDWKSMSMNAKDMDHKENMNNAARRIALTYGVPPQLLGIPGDNKYANLQEARMAMWTDTLLPLLRSMLGSFNNWLQPMYNDGVQLWYDEEMIPALEPLRKAKADRIENSTIMSLNEKRRAMGLDDWEGGDVVLVDSSKIPLELLGDMDLSEPGSEADNEI